MLKAILNIKEHITKKYRATESMIMKREVGIESTQNSWDFLIIRVLVFTINIKVGDL